MASISGLGILKHLRAEPNQYILHYSKGRLTKQGAGLAYWFQPLSSSIAQVPVEDVVTTLLLKERTSDFQPVSLQLTLTYRLIDPEQAATRVNFTLSPDTGDWVENPLDALTAVWQQRVQDPARALIARTPVTEVLRSGPEEVREMLWKRLRSDDELRDMGLALVNVEVDRLAPSAELEKALQTPARESLQQKADEAMFERRALAVEKERAIKENELQTQIELAKREERLIAENGNNRLLGVRQEAQARREETEAEIERARLEADAEAVDVRTRAQGDADAQQVLDEAQAAGEAKRFAVWEKTSGKVLLGLALREFAGKVDHIQHLNLSPSVFANAFESFLTSEAEK